VGVEDLTTDKTSYNLLEQNTFSCGGHHVLGIFSRYNVFRDNYIHNEEWYEYNRRKYGNRSVTIDGANAIHNLFERNRVAFGGISCDDWGGSGVKISSPRNIIRLNCLYDNKLPGLALTAYDIGAVHNYLYNNTIYENGRVEGRHPVVGSPEPSYRQGIDIYYGASKIHSNQIKNNLLYKNPQPCVVPPYGRNMGAQVLSHNWENGDPMFVDDKSPVDPSKADRPDFRLQAGSPCIDKGGFLTTVTSNDGSGETFQVEDAGYFVDGWGIVEGDVIQLEGRNQQARIVSLDCESNTIVVDKTLTWKRNAGVGLAYVGAAPDIGAFEWCPDKASGKAP
jgi:hypothetical protein